MNPSHPSTRRKREPRLDAEVLESRALMTGGAGSTFAVIPGTVAKPGDTVAIKVTIDPKHFHIPQGKFTLGIDIAPDPSGGLKPQVVAVKGPKGQPSVQMIHARYDAHLATTTVTPGAPTSAILTPIRLRPGHTNEPVTYEVDVRGSAGTTGKFVLGFYLPGDAKGTGTVTPQDIQVITAALNAGAGSAKYSFDADANRDGRITRTDLRYAQGNLGVSTDITPVVSANLDPAGILDATQRISRTNSAKFTGTLTPGASVKFEDANQRVPSVSTTADDKGNYALTVKLAEGQNTFKVTTVDAFGQTITGTLAPVTYNTSPPVTMSSFKAVKQPTATINVKS